MERYYFDYAATTPLIPEVKQVMKCAIDDIYGNPSSIHQHGRTAKNEVEAARKNVAGLLNTSLGEIFFTAGATESNNTALIKSVIDLGVRRIISSPTEHHCILHTLSYLQKNYKVDIEYIPVNIKGDIDLDELFRKLESGKEKTLVALMHANNEIGTINPIESIGNICKSQNALFLCDAAQTYGKVPIDLEALNVDFLAASGHKIYAPKGVGVLYINEDISIGPLLHGGSQERNMRSGTENTIGIIGLGKASEIAKQEMVDRSQKVAKIRTKIIEEFIDKNDQVNLNGHMGLLSLPNIMNINLPKNNKTDLMVFNLDIAGISASAGSACSSGVEQASHVLRAINPTDTNNSLRVSFSHFTSEKAVDYLIKTLNGLI
jgi:cysteine desulfurase